MTGPDSCLWGICATIKAPAAEILEFAAHHLELGAHRLFLYLDAPAPAALPHLRAHPKIRLTECTAAYWTRRRGFRPEKHQVRQSLNATRAYRRQSGGIRWLIHMDADEFLWPGSDPGRLLAALPDEAVCARVRPAENLAGSTSAFKAHIPHGPARQTVLNRLYPRYGRELRSGFLSHVQGKLFVRTGLEEVSVRIHNVFQDGTENPGQTELEDILLCHLHGRDWDDWIARYRYRLEQGSYRQGLAAARRRDLGGISVHELLKGIEEEEGESGLKAFFDEVCGDTPGLRSRLQEEGLLRICPLDLAECRKKHFPGFG
jgi:hypothetical protein